jgi:hypothetical protein
VIVAIPISFIWLGNSLWLGRRQERVARAEAEAERMAAESRFLASAPLAEV